MSYGVRMDAITIAYTNHRPETLLLTEPVMRNHHAIILEEPPHPLFQDTLQGRVDIDEYLMEAEYEYPEFSRMQILLLQELYKDGLEILQVEPYLERLYEIQVFFADGNRPDQLDPSSVDYRVYCCEHEATGRLIDYYQAVRAGTFTDITRAMQDFAKADAARFRLRDSLRAHHLCKHLGRAESTYIEAGPMHQLLSSELKACLPAEERTLRSWCPEDRLAGKFMEGGTIYSPGDLLTIRYILGQAVPDEQAELLCSQALIFNQMIVKEEISFNIEDFPHLAQELSALKHIVHLSVNDCRELFAETKELSRTSAMKLVADYFRVKSR
jgi:hypothetical protein